LPGLRKRGKRKIRLFTSAKNDGKKKKILGKGMGQQFRLKGSTRTKKGGTSMTRRRTPIPMVRIVGGGQEVDKKELERLREHWGGGTV